MAEHDVLISLEGICKYFRVTGGTLKAVDNITLDIHRGETFGLVGESGCGKSTLGRVVMGIYTPTAGSLTYDGQQVDIHDARDRFAYAKKAQIIFQDPYASLDPRMTVGSIIEEGMIIHKMYDPQKRQERVIELLELVGLNREHANRFPHEFSGGQRQRVAIARAIAIRPRFVVCDEPVSALDASVQAQVINLLKDLRQRQGLTYLFISHDLSVVRHISTRIVVMYLGHIVEIQDKGDFFREPLHPYSAALLSAIPVANPALQRQRRRIALAGDPGGEESTSCPFYTRCPLAKGICQDAVPALTQTAPGRFVACHCRAGQSA